MSIASIWALWRQPQTLEGRLRQALQCDIELIFSSEGSRRIFVSPVDRGLCIRLDPLFENIEGKDFQSLVGYIQDGDENSKANLIAYLKRVATDRPELLFNQEPMQKLLNDMIKRCFPKLPPIRLVIGRRNRKGAKTKIRLASFWPMKAEIRLHPVMLEEGVPQYYLQFLLYHELCHAHLIFTGQAKSGEHHGPDFCLLEEKFEDIHLARAWEKEHLQDFLKRQFDTTES